MNLGVDPANAKKESGREKGSKMRIQKVMGRDMAVFGIWDPPFLFIQMCSFLLLFLAFLFFYIFLNKVNI